MAEDNAPSSSTVPSAEQAATVCEDDSLPRQPADPALNRAMRKLADRAPEGMVEITAMMGQMGPGHPLHQKMNETHISKMLDLAAQHDTNEYRLRDKQQSLVSIRDERNHKSRLIFFIAFVGLLAYILTLFRNQPTVLVPILTGIGGVVTGFIGGMGYAKTKENETGE